MAFQFAKDSSFATSVISILFKGARQLPEQQPLAMFTLWHFLAERQLGPSSPSLHNIFPVRLLNMSFSLQRGLLLLEVSAFNLPDPMIGLITVQWLSRGQIKLHCQTISQLNEWWQMCCNLFLFQMCFQSLYLFLSHFLALRLIHHHLKKIPQPI